MTETVKAIISDSAWLFCPASSELEKLSSWLVGNLLCLFVLFFVEYLALKPLLWCHVAWPMDIGFLQSMCVYIWSHWVMVS